MSRRAALPVSLYVAGRRVAVVGDGPGADERAARLADAGAEVIRMTAAEAAPDALSGCLAVVAHPAATDADSIAAAARRAGCLAYVHDRPDLSDFAMPALVRRGPVTFAVATDGVAPALSRRLREEIERLVDAAGDDLDALVEVLEARRAALPAGERGSLYQEARRLRIDGRIHIAPAGSGDAGG